MDGARASNDEEAALRISALDASDDFMTGTDDGRFGVFGLRKGESRCIFSRRKDILGRFRAEGGSEESMG